MDDIFNEIIDAYIEIVKTTKTKPNTSSFAAMGINRDKISRRFGTMDSLHEYMVDNHKEFLSEHYATVDDVFHTSRSANNSEKKRFLITTAVAEAEAHQGFLNAMNVYSETNDAQVVIMPCESITNSFENRTATFDKVFSAEKYMFVTEDTPLNDNISLCSIQVSAKQIKPITGMLRIGSREGSYVFASPKQFLEYIPSGNSRDKNYSIMTPGACTLPKYYTEKFVSKRLSYIADYDHTMGAIIVELDGKNHFHFRQIQADQDGSFIDLGKMYHHDGKITQVETNIVFGDLHGIHHDPKAVNAMLKFVKSSKLKIGSVYLHDIFDGYSISHHIKDIAEKQTRSINNKNKLSDELVETFNLVKHIESSTKPSKVVVVKSNHDEFLTRYLSSGRYVEDPENHYLSLKIATAQFEGEDVIKRGFESVGKTVPNSWEFLGRGDTSEIGGVECGSHGDLGLNGARASLNSLEKVYGDCVIGHNHSAAIQRGVFRVGTMTLLDMGYNRGPSSWTQTNCLVYGNGQRQLVNFINGKYSSEN